MKSPFSPKNVSFLASRHFFSAMKLPSTEYQYLRELQRNAKHKRNYVKITVLLMLHMVESYEKIALCLGISDSTVSNYEKKYQAKGLDLHLQDHYHGYEGKLNEEEQKVLCAELDNNLYLKLIGFL